MKLSLAPVSVALSLSLSITACVAPTEGTDTTVSEDRRTPAGPGTAGPRPAGRANLRAIFNKDGVKREGAGACKFQDDAAGPADAFVIANGQDVSVVFTRLGEPTRRGRKNNRVASRCNFVIPIDVPDDAYISAWNQRIQYGVVKPLGVAAGVGLDSALRNSAGGMLRLPGIDVRFTRQQDLNVALDIAPADTLSLDGENTTHKNWKKRSCNAHRVSDLAYVGSAFTWSERDNDNTEVIIAIDGLDTRFDLGSVMESCPP